jgi:hypothetical protein
VKPKPKAVNKPSPHFIVHGLDKPGGFTTVSFFQPFSPSHCVLARTPVCKPFARECWLVRNDRWPVGSHIRKYRWPKNTRVCKPTSSRLQAATAIDSIVGQR